VLGPVEEQTGLGCVEGQLLVGEVADEVLGLPQGGGIGVGGVFAGAPVGGPEWGKQSLAEAAST
jgi:hypothetical protein